MDHDVLIRRFSPADEPAVVDLWTRVFGYSSPHNEPRSVIREKLAADPELFFVAVIDETVAGTVMAGYDGHRGWIYSLAVEPQFRRRVCYHPVLHAARVHDQYPTSLPCNDTRTRAACATVAPP